MLIECLEPNYNTSYSLNTTIPDYFQLLSGGNTITCYHCYQYPPCLLLLVYCMCWHRIGDYSHLPTLPHPYLISGQNNKQIQSTGQGCSKRQKVAFKISTLVFPSTWHVKKFQPSRQTRTPSIGYHYFQQGTSKGNTCKFTEWSYLSPCAKIKKIKGTLFPSTFEISENKVHLVFSIFAQGLRYSYFLNLRMLPC